MAKGIFFIESVRVFCKLQKYAPDITHLMLAKRHWHLLSKENGFQNLTDLLKAFKKEGLNIHKITVK